MTGHGHPTPAAAARQAPPRLGNQYRDDALLASWLHRVLPEAVRAAVEPELERMGELAGGELYRLQLDDRLNEPRLTRWDAWGERVDRIEPTAVWRRAAPLAAESGLVALPYERPHGRHSRAVQFALVHLFTPSTDFYGCPLAMSDGAARALLDGGVRRPAERAVPRLTTRDPARAWTSGQWMTELGGGSDVGGATETVARRDDRGRWRLYGRKWFTSAAASEMALTLARPEGAAAGSRGLTLFYVECRDAEGRLAAIRLERLKDKLGTRKLPTAEMVLEGTPAEPASEPGEGVRAIAPMLNVTRLWNAVTAASLSRRGLALAVDYAGRRRAFGAPLARQPLHADTLAALAAEQAGAFHLAFEVAALLGRREAGELDGRGEVLLRLLTPIAKLTTAKQAVAIASEVLECFGGAGYVEDTGLPALLRDAQVLPIWEGTTNVLALDTLRAVAASGGGLKPLRSLVAGCAAEIAEPELVQAAQAAGAALERAELWLLAHAGDRDRLEAGARRLALTAGRAVEAALAARHGQWSLDHEGSDEAAAAAVRLAAHGVDRLGPERAPAGAAFETPV